MISRLNIGRVLALGCASMLAAGTARADVVTAWNEQVVTNGGPQIQRTLAMVHIGMFDATNAIEKTYTPYLRLPEPPRACVSDRRGRGRGLRRAHTALSSRGTALS